MISGPGHTRRGVPPCRLEQDIAVGQLGQLFFHQWRVELVGDHDYVFGANYGQHAVVAHLKQRTSGAEEINELFWAVGAAVRPKTAPDTAAHYYTIAMIVNHGESFWLTSAKVVNNGDLRKRLI